MSWRTFPKRKLPVDGDPWTDAVLGLEPERRLIAAPELAHLLGTECAAARKAKVKAEKPAGPKRLSLGDLRAAAQARKAAAA
jgi:hypothetical protein